MLEAQTAVVINPDHRAVEAPPAVMPTPESAIPQSTVLFRRTPQPAGGPTGCDCWLWTPDACNELNPSGWGCD